MSKDHVTRVLDVLSDVPDDKVKSVLAGAELRRRESTVSERRRFLDNLFSRQLEVLAERGCPDVLREQLVSLRKTTIDKALASTATKGNPPFLLVVPPPFLSYHTLASMLRNGTNVGYTRLNVRLITDVLKVPEDPYVIYDVEDGRALLGKSPADAEKLIKQQNRAGLTAAEALNLCIQTNTLNHHFVDAVGSRFGSDVVPVLWLNDARPSLFWLYRGFAFSLWGAASCGSR